MRRPLSPLLIVLAGVAAAASLPGAARAQELELPDARQGYFISVGPRAAVSKVWMDNENYGAWSGYDLSFHFGQMVTRRFGLGLNVHNGALKGDGQSASLFGLGLEAQFALRPRLAIHAVTGIDTVSVRADDGKDKSLRGTAGAGYALGVSYSWFFTHRLSGGFALTPRLDVRYVPGSTSSMLAGFLGLEIAWWTGLPRNQLELPSSEAYKVKGKKPTPPPATPYPLPPQPPPAAVPMPPALPPSEPPPPAAN